MRRFLGLQTSLFRCTQKCTRFLIFPVARLRQSSSRFKRASSIVSNDRHKSTERRPLTFSRTSQQHKPTSDSTRHVQPNQHPRHSTFERSAKNEKKSEAAHKHQARPSPVVRLPKLNGADLYVVRTTKAGLACSKPCWRW